MRELIKVKESEGRPGVDARELHGFLEVKSRFNDWMRNRLSKYGFNENEDFVVFTKNLAGGGTAIEYTLSLDMANELAMVENNAKGREARRYFIRVEKKYREEKSNVSYKIPQNYAQALFLAAKQAEQIEAQKPLVETAQALAHSPETESMSITNAAKHFGLHPRKVVFPYLREKRYLTSKNLPTTLAIDRDVLSIRETVIRRGQDEDDKIIQAAVVEVRQLITWKNQLVPRIKRWAEEAV